MRNLRPGGEAHRSPRARLVKRKAFIGGAGAGDVLLWQKAIGAAANDLVDWLERRGHRQSLGHYGGDDASRAGQGLRQMRKRPRQTEPHGAVVEGRQLNPARTAPATVKR